MARMKNDSSIADYQAFIETVWQIPNDRAFSAWDMLVNVERFLLRGIKGIRKEQPEKTKTNLLISLSWFISLMNQLHIDLGDQVWKRFSYHCSYCGYCPCACKAKKIQTRRRVKANPRLRPKTIQQFQQMFEAIYPAGSRTLDQAGIHLAEEIGELAEAVLTYRGAHRESDFTNVILEAADLFSCFMGVFNSLGADVAASLAKLFFRNCQVCHLAPCTCDFDQVMKFKV